MLPRSRLSATCTRLGTSRGIRCLRRMLVRRGASGVSLLLGVCLAGALLAPNLAAEEHTLGQTVSAAADVAAGATTGHAANASSTDVRVVREIVYARRTTGDLRGDLYLPASDSHAAMGQQPAVLLIHGGAWAAGMRTHAAWHARRLAHAGFAAFTIDYRLAPVHKFPAQLEDCHDGLAWLATQGRNYSIDSTQLAAFGYSAGGHLACLLGNRLAQQMSNEQQRAEPDAATDATTAIVLKAIVAGGAPCDFRREPLDSTRLAFWLGGRRREIPETYRLASPVEFVGPQSPPTFFFHGDRDQVVPPSDPRALHRRLRQAGVATELFLVPDSGHVKAYTNRAALGAAIKFLRQHLSATEPE